MATLQVNTQQTLTPPQPDPAEASRLKKQFYIMAFCFAINHATVTTPLQYSSSLLTTEIGNLSNSVLYGMTLICSLFFANVIYAVLGGKKGLAISMALYAVYVLCFAMAINSCQKETDTTIIECNADAEPLAIGGAVIGGFGAGLLWTCQGAFYSMVCGKLAIAEDRPLAEATANLGGVFALIFLGGECTVRAMTSVLTGAASDSLKISEFQTFLIWAAFAVGSGTFFAVFAEDLQPPTPAARGGITDKLLAAVSLWKDPKLWLLQFTNITFGFAVAWIGGYVAPNILKKTLGTSFIGFAGAMLSGTAAILSRVFAPIAVRIGKGPILALGAVAFVCIALLSKFAVGDAIKGKDGQKVIDYKPSPWGDGVVLFYVLMGIGRAVYESTNKAIVADIFPGDKAPGAFANVFVFGTAASTFAFALASQKINQPFYYLLIVFAAITVPGYMLAVCLKKAEDVRTVTGDE